MNFAQWWDSDEAFVYRHDDERTQAEAAWNAAIEAAAKVVEDNGPVENDAHAANIRELLAK